jgi:hypothetical protein
MPVSVVQQNTGKIGCFISVVGVTALAITSGSW